MSMLNDLQGLMAMVRVLLNTKGPVIFNARYRGGVKQGGVSKYFATFSWGMKTFCHVLMGCENIFE